MVLLERYAAFPYPPPELCCFPLFGLSRLSRTHSRTEPVLTQRDLSTPGDSAQDTPRAARQSLVPWLQLVWALTASQAIYSSTELHLLVSDFSPLPSPLSCYCCAGSPAVAQSPFSLADSPRRAVRSLTFACS